eukprot:SAG25_NODE_9014_length_392_cov_0.761092_1_plen_73_part_01
MLASSLRRTPERRSKQALAHVQRQLRTTLSTLRPDRVLHARTHARTRCAQSRGLPGRVGRVMTIWLARRAAWR